ncbi:DNA-binding transcriptional regulator, LysR family [Psychrobacillus sp. OK028]|uniref:LysR family transcriptional regulator n=1 Tax=Psychrobacillus sp. OK028 TaxID=1884359 RepID=UPI00087EC59E|nr:LysR family transcriptional regulator [Psychrobacillus sp. OK028]SDM37160.1 DNA-binding transcriptional regulator, LysR family [Psychrobacillus sp. OK028]
MQLEQLLHIIYANKFRSLTKAAEELYISQSAISQSISKLEVELGLSLFTRSRNGVVPTKDAPFFLNRAEQIIKIVDEMNEKSNKSNQLNKKLSIGTVAGLHLHFLTPALLSFQKKFPFLDIEYIENSSLALRESVINHELDISLIVLYEKTMKPHHSINIQPLMDIKFYVLVSKDSPLSEKTYAKYEDIASEPFVMHNGEFMNWFLSNYVDRNGKLHLLFKSNNTDTLRATIAKGTAITIETENELYSNPDIMSGQVVAIPLLDLGLPKTSLGLIYSTKKYFSPEKAEIVKSLSTYITEWKYEQIL